MCFFFSSRRRHTRLQGDWSSDVCSSDLGPGARRRPGPAPAARGVPARGHARRVRTARPDRARWRGTGPGRQGQPGNAGPRAAPASAGRGPGTGVGAGSGRDRGRGHVRAAVRGPAEPGLPQLPGRLQLPGARLRRAGDPVTGRVSYTPAQLAMLLGLPEPTGEQAAVIAAPLAPMAVIAGAGSGKSETMAARLVWLVANGLVTPERALGLTFTRKAAAEFGQRVRARLAGLRRAGLAMGPTEPAGPGGPAAPRGDGRPRGEAPAAEETLGGEPVVSTYHAYAARLVADHALREALEPSLRLITPAVCWQIAARVVAGYGGPMDAVDRTPQWVTAAVLDLAAELAEHLRTPAEVEQAGRWLDTACQTIPGRVPALVRKISACQRTREQLLPMVAAYTQAKAAREVIDYGDQVALAARIASRHPQVGAIERARYQ